MMDLAPRVPLTRVQPLVLDLPRVPAAERPAVAEQPAEVRPEAMPVSAPIPYYPIPRAAPAQAEEPLCTGFDVIYVGVIASFAFLTALVPISTIVVAWALTIARVP